MKIGFLSDFAKIPIIIGSDEPYAECNICCVVVY